jgi:hypothetical protein
MPEKQKYCVRCGWKGSLETDKCPGCGEMSHLMDLPKTVALPANPGAMDVSAKDVALA